MPSVLNRLESERNELDLVLSSEMFGRTNSLSRFLNYVCNMYFAGTSERIKEYSIAVEALGRPADFDPQTDTIVRVTAHALRRRLEDYYRTIGADHPIQICLPAGHYVPKFVNRNGHATNGSPEQMLPAAQAVGDPPSAKGSAVPLPDAPAYGPDTSPAATQASASGKKAAGVIIGALVIASFVLVFTVWRPLARRSTLNSPAPAKKGSFVVPAIDRATRVLVGENRPAYTDHEGFEWQPDRFCSGGTSFSVSDRKISGTEDPALFLAGRSGTFRCRIPAPAGIYDVHLLFAETSGLQENTRNVSFSINGGPVSNLDVVDDAAGDDAATTKVFPGIQPADDGTIHLDFTSPQSFVNAIEIVPGVADSIQPVRIVAGHSLFRDSRGNVWLPDKYAFGGRLSRFSGDVSKFADGGLYEWQRMGHFHYVIPVAAGRTYTVRMYFHEPWFGSQNGNVGGVGSRVFDVSCNGSALLRNFDILHEAGPAPLVRSFAHVQPTAQGKIEIYFTPVVNYPAVSAVEVIPE